MTERDFPVDPWEYLPPLTDDNAPFWAALQNGEMTAQHCDDCGRARFPIAPVCPLCGATAWRWRGLTGKGHVFAWVRYHRSFLPEFADLVPYVVITAALDGGVRMIGRLLEQDIQPKIGQSITMLVERWPGGRCVPVFSLKPSAAHS